MSSINLSSNNKNLEAECHIMATEVRILYGHGGQMVLPFRMIAKDCDLQVTGVLLKKLSNSMQPEEAQQAWAALQSEGYARLTSSYDNSVIIVQLVKNTDGRFSILVMKQLEEPQQKDELSKLRSGHLQAKHAQYQPK